MKKNLLLVLGLILSIAVPAQMDRYWVQFSDKNNSPFSVSSPSAYLSSKAIGRRTVQGIPVTVSDLPVNPWYIDSLVNKGATVINRSKWLNGAVIYTSSPAVVSSIQALPFVSSVTGVAPLMPNEQNIDFTRTNSKFGWTTPSIVPQIELTSPAAFNYGASFNQVSQIGADCLHNMDYQGQGMIIAVIDAGFWGVDTMVAFDSLWANNQIISTWDFVSGNNMVYEDHTHGTMVLSCMGGNTPGQLIGTAPKAKFILLRSEDAWSEYIIEEYNWAAAAEYADSAGADVINTSLGYTTFDDPSQNHNYADLNGDVAPISVAHDIAASKGMLVVCSAGNSGPSTIGAPADADSALTVGAVNQFGTLAGFSSHGPSSDGDVKPNVVAMGEGTIVAFPGGGYGGGNGTSFSSPVMAGGVACLWQAHPTFSNMQIINAIQQSANQFSNPDSLFGYGIPNLCTADQLLMGINPSVFSEDIIQDPFPNPFSDAFQFSVYSEKKQVMIVDIFDLSGKRLLVSEKVLKPASHNTFRITEVSDLRSGVYIFSMKLEDRRIVKKMVKN